MFIICVAEVHMKGACILRAYCVFEYQVYLYVGAQHQNIRWIKNEIESELFGETMFLLLQLHPPLVRNGTRESFLEWPFDCKTHQLRMLTVFNMSGIAFCVHRNANQDVSCI